MVLITQMRTADQIDGITFPVKVTDDMDMSKYTLVADGDSVDITVTIQRTDKYNNL